MNKVILKTAVGILHIISAILIASASSSCESRREIVREKGYLFYFSLKHLYFIPAKSISSNCVDDFKSENLHTGIQFNVGVIYSRNTVQDIVNGVDTLALENVAVEMSPMYKSIKIMPIEIEYRKTNEYYLDQDHEPLEMKLKINKADIYCKYKVAPISHVSVYPLDCTNN